MEPKTDIQPYSKRELDHFFSELTAHLTKQDKSLERIETQTMKTNGRVSKLEQWRSIMVWGFGIVVAVGTTLFNKIIFMR